MSLSGESLRTAAAWLIDFDNTLAALEKEVDWAESRRELEAMLRATDCPADLFELFPKGNLPLYDALLHRLRTMHHGLTAADRELLSQASAIIERHELIGVERAQPLPGAIELLRIVGRARPVAIVTSNSSKTVTRWLQRHQLSITAIMGRDRQMALKPAPESVDAALGLLRVEAAQAIFAGDSPADLMAARAAEVRFVGIAPSATIWQRLQQAGAEVIFGNPADLAERLMQAEGR